MLKKFTVKNFRQFASLELDFANVRDYEFQTACLTNKSKSRSPLIKTALIYGANASGKTNLGFAMFDVVQTLQDLHSLSGEYANYVNADHPKEPVSFSYTFLLGGGEIQYQYSKDAPNSLLSEKLTINEEPLFYWDTEKGTENFDGLAKYKLDTLNWKQLPLDGKPRTLSFLRYIANNSILSKDSPISKIMDFVGKMIWVGRADRDNNFIGFYPTEEPIDSFIIREHLVKDFQKFLNENQVSEKIFAAPYLNGRETLYFAHKVPLPFFETASSGTIALTVYYYWKQILNKCSFVFMDEYDVFYHFELSKHIFDNAKKLKCQCLLTTHNTSLLNHRNIRPDACFLMKDGKLKAFPGLTKREIREGNNLERLFVSGEFDG